MDFDSRVSTGGVSVLVWCWALTRAHRKFSKQRIVTSKTHSPSRSVVSSNEFIWRVIDDVTIVYGVSAYFTFYRLSYFYRTVVHYSLTSRIYPVTYKQTKRAEKTEKRKKENQLLKRAGEKNWVVYLSHFVENLDVSRHNNDNNNNNGTPKKRLEFVNVWSFEINRWRPIFPCAFLCRGYEHELGICCHKTGTCHMPHTHKPKYRIACANKSTHPPNWGDVIFSSQTNSLFRFFSASTSSSSSLSIV